MILILFLQGVDPNIAVFFATHFLIHHSFLDFLYMGFPAIRGNYLSGRRNILFPLTCDTVTL
jgi:hypothetical protein